MEPVGTLSDRIWDLHGQSVVAGDELGYPADVEFVPDGQAWTEQAVWQNLREAQATLLVGERMELLMTPAKRTIGDRIRRRVRVRVAPRVGGVATPFSIPAALTVGALRGLLGA